MSDESAQIADLRQQVEYWMNQAARAREARYKRCNVCGSGMVEEPLSVATFTSGDVFVGGEWVCFYCKIAALKASLEACRRGWQGGDVA